MGYVQYNIGSVLDTLLGLLELVEKYVKNPPAEYQKLSHERERVVLEEPTAIIRGKKHDKILLFLLLTISF